MRAIETFCPTCRYSVIVVAGRIEEHRAFFGRIVRGVRMAERCPASSRVLLPPQPEEICHA